jgi:hypothetical protein
LRCPRPHQRRVSLLRALEPPAGTACVSAVCRQIKLARAGEHEAVEAPEYNADRFLLHSWTPQTRRCWAPRISAPTLPRPRNSTLLLPAIAKSAPCSANRERSSQRIEFIIKFHGNELALPAFSENLPANGKLQGGAAGETFSLLTAYSATQSGLSQQICEPAKALGTHTVDGCR